VPQFAASSSLLTDAYRFAHEAHEGPRRRSDTSIAHPTAVAALLHEVGYPEHVVVVALLHDVVEDTATSLAELQERFGPDVARLVGQLTEDPDIEPYLARKGELRDRAAGDGHHAAAIFTADKLATALTLNAEGAGVAPEKLEHYERTIRTVREHHPEVPFLDALDTEVARLRERD
jgi:(p)ppGpp synthase/HD superfamily hydrolase